MDRYYVIRSMLGREHSGTDSGMFAVTDSPGGNRRIGMATQCGPPAGQRSSPGLARYTLRIGDQNLDGEWTLDGDEFRRLP